MMSEIKKIFGLMNFQKKSRNMNYWHEKLLKLTLIPNSSRPIATFFYGKFIEVKGMLQMKKEYLE